MQYQLINHSSDLKRLRDEGYQISVTGGGLLVIHHVPYVNQQRQILSGKLICPVEIGSFTQTLQPSDHTMYFIGDLPCHKDGLPLEEIINSSPNHVLADGYIGNHYLSSKPINTGRYDDYCQKVKRYIDIISGPAKSLDPKQSARNYQPIPDEDDAGVFRYYDTNSSRANIIALNDKFAGLKIGIIGVGGTGAYILDFLSKTRVGEIHLFDSDTLKVHNAFRSPGAAHIDELSALKKKVEFFSEKYSNMHMGIIPHAVNINDDTFGLLEGLSFAFICVDSNSVRSAITTELTRRRLPFIDTGLGVQVMDGQLTSIIRTTAGMPEKFDHLSKRILSEDIDDNEYGTNIQIAELNAANAVFAIIRWKKWLGFYQDLKQEFHSTYSSNVNVILNEDDNLQIC